LVIRPEGAPVERVALGRLVVIAGKSVASRLGETVTAVVVDLPDTVLVLAWSQPIPTPQLAALITAATQAAGLVRHPKAS
jgi:hypothetical protein